MLPEWNFCSCCFLKASEHNMHSVCLPLRQGTLNILLCVSGCSWFIPIRAYAGPRRNIVAFLKGRIIRAQSVGQQEPFGFLLPPLACGCSSAVGRTVPSVLGVAVENCTKRDRPRGICAAQSHCCVLEGLLELWWPVLSLTPSVG